MILSSLPEGKELLLNQAVVPGIMQDVSVSGTMQADRNERADGGRDFELKGWEPASISIKLKVVGDLEKGIKKEALLQQLAALFKKTEGGTAVQYSMALPQTKAWGVGRCYFTGMSSSQNTSQSYSVSLEFVEFRPEIDQIKKQQKAKEEAKKTSAAEPAGPAPAQEPLLSKEQKQRLSRLEEKERFLGNI